MANKVLSLFCGAGGLDHGFREAGFETVVAVDACADAVASFNANIGAVATVADLSKLSPGECLSLLPEGDSITGIIGGPPCQGFSRANSFSSEADPRNELPFRYAEILAAANEKFALDFFAFENVVGMKQAKHLNRSKKLLQKFHEAGFNLFEAILDAADFKVPQRRKRLFIVGLNRTKYPELKMQFPEGTDEQLTVLDVLGGLPKPRFFERGLSPKDISVHPNHWTMRPKSQKFKGTGQGTGRSFRKLSWTQLSPTVAYGNREIHVHPDGDRRLSIYESLLLQGFPDSYVLKGSLSSQVTQVSNAVPPPVAKAVAEAILKMLPSDSRKSRD